MTYKYDIDLTAKDEKVNLFVRGRRGFVEP